MADKRSTLLKKVLKMELAAMYLFALFIPFLKNITFICFNTFINFWRGVVFIMSEENNKMIKFEHRAVIKFLSREGNTPTQIRERMLKVFLGSCSSEYVIKFWSKQFKHGRESLEDDPRSGRPISAVTTENVEKVKQLILVDRRIKQWEVARDVGISKERVHEIIHGHLGMSKVSARWVPRMLTPLMLTPVHTAFTARSSLNKNGFAEINHPPYSPDLAPCDYFLFKNLKKNLRGRRFSTDEEMKEAVNDHFDTQDKTYFFNGLMSLIDKCHKCISVAGDYIEK